MIPLIGIIIVVLLGVAISVYVKQRGLTLEAIKGLPMTRLQKRAWLSLAIGLSLSAAIVALFAVQGFDAYDQDPTMQHTVLGLFLGTIMASLLTDPFGLPKRDGSEASDERDSLIMDRAPRVQAVAIILTLAAWLIFLTVHYHGASVVPKTFLYLIFFSALIAYTLGLSLGILMGYRKMGRYGEG
ncbi:MAG: hypothetical protein HOB49_12925 [Gemmatimonadetes bacterium]|nr:hypothetical protein [Gemmatimonadota bacterium]